MTRGRPVSRRLATLSLGLLIWVTGWLPPVDQALRSITDALPSVPHYATIPAALAGTPCSNFSGDYPLFTGHLSNSSGTQLSETISGDVYGRVTNVNDTWDATSCYAYRYDAVLWATDNSTTNLRVNWGLLAGDGAACRYVIGTADYIHANSGSCPGSPTTARMVATLTPEAVYHADVNLNGKGDFAFAHADCTTDYGAEVIKTGASTSVTTGKPGANCGNKALDSTNTAQTLVVDGTAPVLAITAPAAGGPAVIAGTNTTVTFNVTEATAGFSGADDWELRRQSAPATPAGCGTFANDPAADALVTGTTTGTGLTSVQTLPTGACYRWILNATDANGNVATQAISGSVRRDVGTLLGQQGHHLFESWDLGAGDSLAINVATSNVMLSHPITTLPIRGSSFGITLAYNAQDLANVGLGTGWRLDLQRRLMINGDATVTLTDDSGARHTFANPTTIGTVTSYTRPATTYATLVKDTSVAANEFILTYEDQSRDKFDIAGSEGVLVREEDRFGNGVTVAYSSGTDISTVTDSAGRQVLFTWDTAPTPHRLTKVEDWAYVSGGIVQTSATGTRRAYRFFYDGGGQLAGWSDPLETAGSCPTGASHVTCLEYTDTLLARVKKTQTVTGISGSTLGTTSRLITTEVAYVGGDVSTVTDAEEYSKGSPARTAFSRPAAGQSRVIRPGTPASQVTYALVSPSDSLARVQSIKRLLTSAGTEIEQRTVWDSTFPTEPVSVTDNYGALLSTPARTTTYTYVSGSPGNVQKVVEPLTPTTNRWTEYVYNANNDVSLKTVSLDGSVTDRTVTKSCYSTQSNTCPTSETGLSVVRQIDRWVSGGATDEDTNVATDFAYDTYGQRTRTTRHNKAPDGSSRDDRADGAVYDNTGNQTTWITNHADGAVTLGTDDISPNATTGARTDLTSVFAYDTAGNRVSSADPRRAIALSATTYARDGFNRTVVNGWGTADTGGAWSSTTADHDVNGSIGTVSLSSNTNRNAYLTSVSAQDQEVLVKIRDDHLAVGSTHLLWVYLRRQDSSNYYQARISFNTTGSISAFFNRTGAGTTTVIDAGTTDIPHATGDWYWMRARISGTTAVRGQVKLWRDGTTEPVAWEVDGTDSTPPAALQGSGHVGIRFQLGGSYSGTYPVVASFDEFTVTTIGGGGQSLAADDYVTRWTYDAVNSQKTETTPTTPGVATAQKTQTTVYDELSQARLATDFGGVVSGTESDRAGRAMKTFEDTPVAAAAVTSQTTYDAGGRVATTKDRRQYADAALGSTQYSYDSLGRQLAVLNAFGTALESETDTAYDALWRQISLEVGVGSPASQLTTYSYDLGGRPLTTDDGFTCSTATFDYRGLALTTTEGLTSGPCTSGADSRTLTNTYDGLGRLTRSQVTAGVGTNDRTIDDTLDSVGNKITSGVLKGGVPSTSTFTVNPLDQAVAEARPDGSTAKTTFDAAGNTADRCFWKPAIAAGSCLPVGTAPWTNPPTQSTTTTSDARNKRIGLVDSVTTQTTVYDADHGYLVKAIYLPTLADLTKELQSLFGYDDRHRLIEVKHQVCTVSTGHSCSSTSAIGETDYAYDDNDNRTQVVESNGAATTDRRYCYDALDRLQYRNTAAACNAAAKDESYVYDDTGNRTQTVVGGVTTNFAFNAEGQLCKVGSMTCTSPNVAYDTAGRTETWSGWTFTYDAEARLISACKSATCVSGFDKVEFAYDGEGHRTQIRATTAAGAVSTIDFRYQSDAIVEEKLTDATHAGVVVRSYVVDDADTVVKMTIPAGEPNAGTYIPGWNGHGDALNLSRLNSDGTLTLANSFEYSSWGKPSTALHNGISDLGFRFLYVGQAEVQWDDTFGLGLAYMRARHYAPELGRFLQPDPARAEGSQYVYARNSPITRMDPSGCQSFSWKELKKLGCRELKKFIEEMISFIEDKLEAIAQNPAGQYRFGRVQTIQSHINRIATEQARLREAMIQWNFKDCGEPPPAGPGLRMNTQHAWRLATRAPRIAPRKTWGAGRPRIDVRAGPAFRSVGGWVARAAGGTMGRPMMTN